MKITYVYHSCYTVELARHFLVFDYYKGELPAFPAGKQPVFFVSHAHYDHYQPRIWEYADCVPSPVYVVDQGVPHPELPGVQVVSCNQSHTIEGIEVRTLRSTDEGVAFLLRIGKTALYHAGDLNWWHWEGASVRENDHHRYAFFHELEKLRGTKLDVAFLPLDPRQEGNAWWGIKAFLEAVAVSHVFPMHFGDETEAMSAYLEKELKPYPMIEKVSHCGQEFVLEESD